MEDKEGVQYTWFEQHLKNGEHLYKLPLLEWR